MMFQDVCSKRVKNLKLILLCSANVEISVYMYLRRLYNKEYFDELLLLFLLCSIEYNFST